MTYIHTNLKFWRKKEGLSQEKFASKLGINRGKLATYEESTEPRQAFLMELAERFRINLHYFLTREMTENSFDAFFLEQKAASLLSAPKKQSQLITRLMTLKQENLKEAREVLIDRSIIEISSLMEENHDLRAELITLLKQMGEK